MEYHELAHEQIMAYHSCKVISEGGGWDQGRFVEYRQCEVYGPRSEEERLQEIKLHSWNDVIYYAVQGILSYLICMVLLLYAARRDK